MKIDLGKYIFNAFWFVTFVFATVALFFAIIPLNKLALKSDEFRIGEMQVESLGFSRGKGKGTAKRFLIGKINSMEKTIVLNEYQNVNAADIEVGSTTKVWFHDKFVELFL